MQIQAFEAKSEMNKKNGKRTWEKEEEEDRKKRKNETYGLAVWLWEWVGVWVRGRLSLILIKQNTELSEKDDTFTAF